MRPPPGWVPPQSARTSPPHADLRIISSSRGRIDRNLSACEEGGAAAWSPDGVPVAADPVGAPALSTAFWHACDNLDLFFCRQLSAALPPGGTLAQFFW